MPITNQSIETWLRSRENNFDLIRLIAAGLVLFSHTYELYRVPPDPWSRLAHYETFGGVAVAIFFIISGFLVARSYLTDPRPVAYMTKRCLRIFPALIGCVLVTVFVLGACMTPFTPREYFLHPQTRDYLRCICLYDIRFNLPLVFAHNPLPHTVNGSLWTLPVEFTMYLAVLAFGMLRALSRRWIWVILAGILLMDWQVLHWFWPGKVAQLAKAGMLIQPLLKLSFLFFVGALFYLYRDAIRLDWRIFLLSVFVIAVSLRTPQGPFIFSVALGYVVIYLGFAPIPGIRWITHWGDFSYGVYLYAFPVQQALIQLSLRNGVPALRFRDHLILSTVITLALAVISWFVIEKPALSLKKRRKATVPVGALPALAVDSPLPAGEG